MLNDIMVITTAATRIMIGGLVIDVCLLLSVIYLSRYSTSSKMGFKTLLLGEEKDKAEMEWVARIPEPTVI